MGNIWEKPYPNQLRRFRKQAGFTQRELAKLIGHKTTAHISRYENGAKLPSLLTALKICAAIRSLVEVVFGDLHDKVSEQVIKRKETHGLWERN